MKRKETNKGELNKMKRVLETEGKYKFKLIPKTEHIESPKRDCPHMKKQKIQKLPNYRIPYE